MKIIIVDSELKFWINERVDRLCFQNDPQTLLPNMIGLRENLICVSKYLISQKSRNLDRSNILLKFM